MDLVSIRMLDNNGGGAFDTSKNPHCLQRWLNDKEQISHRDAPLRIAKSRVDVRRKMKMMMMKKRKKRGAWDDHVLTE